MQRTLNPLSISMPNSICRALSKEWRHYLIIFVPDLCSQQTSLEARLRNLWNLQKEATIKYLGLQHYLLSNINSGKRLEILTTCPWYLDKCPLLTRSCLANFSPSSSSRFTSIWISLPHLLVEYICPDILRLIGNSLGKSIALDQNNLNKSVISVSRICVEINISNPPLSSIIFNGINIPTTYENLSLYNSNLFKSMLPLLPTPPIISPIRTHSVFPHKTNFQNPPISFSKNEKRVFFKKTEFTFKKKFLTGLSLKSSLYPRCPPAASLHQKVAKQTSQKKHVTKHSTLLHLIPNYVKAKDKLCLSKLSSDNSILSVQHPSSSNLNLNKENSTLSSISLPSTPLSSPSPATSYPSSPTTQHPIISTPLIFPFLRNKIKVNLHPCLSKYY